MTDLRAVVVMDYQNVHLTGHSRFAATRNVGKHEALVDPLLFAHQLLKVRNARQRADRPAAVLREVDVYRGLPNGDHDPSGYARNLAQKAHWERDKRVTVTHRPLRYQYQRDRDGHVIRDPLTGIKVPLGPPSEKGVDVLCALSLVRHARRPDVDVVVLASLDSDLIPALDEVYDMHQRVETFSGSSQSRV